MGWVEITRGVWEVPVQVSTWKGVARVESTAGGWSLSVTLGEGQLVVLDGFPSGAHARLALAEGILKAVRAASLPRF